MRSDQTILAKISLLPFLDIASADMKLRFSPKKRSHYTNCRLIPNAVIQHDKNMINEFNQCLTGNYDHVMPLRTLLHGQMIR